MRDQSDLYYECHVTIKPVFGRQRELLSKLIEPYGFKLAELVMMKGANPEDWSASQKDTFFTAHSKFYSRLQLRMVRCIIAVQCADFEVMRYKIEDTIIDSLSKDILGLLNDGS